MNVGLFLDIIADPTAETLAAARPLPVILLVAAIALISILLIKTLK